MQSEREHTPDLISRYLVDVADYPLNSSSEGQSGRRAIPLENFQRIVTTAEVIADFLTSALAVYAAYFVYLSLGVGKAQHYPLSDLTVLSCAVGFLVVVLFERDSAYEGCTSLLRIRETERSLRIPCTALLLTFPVSFLAGHSFSRGGFICAAILLPAALLLQKNLFFSALQSLHVKGYGVQRVVIYGGGYTGRRILTALANSPRLGFFPVSAVDDDPALHGLEIHELGYRRKHSIAIHGGPATADYLKSVDCDMLIIAIPSLSPEAVLVAVEAANQANATVALVPDRLHLNNRVTTSVDLDGLLLSVSNDLKESWNYRITKRAFDFVVAAVLLMLLAPLLGLLSILIKLDSAGPVFFQQERVGKNGQKFNIFKLRSMRVDAPKYAISPDEAQDSRITRIGRLLRRTSMDELPQLLNVLRGEMSLVGPRPEMAFITEQYNLIQRQRLQVMPGITGLWQISADRNFHIHESPEYDMYYIRNRGFFLDLSILIHTAIFAARGI
jgi:exopolysaccharide biosynthesis polyprenyl glycosylphosphotransferase